MTLSCSRCEDTITSDGGASGLHYVMAFKRPDFSEIVYVLCEDCMTYLAEWYGYGTPDKFVRDGKIVSKDRIAESLNWKGK